MGSLTLNIEETVNKCRSLLTSAFAFAIIELMQAINNADKGDLLMYSEQDWKEINALLKKRWLITLVPSGIALAAAIAIFVYGQLNRHEYLWMLTAFLTLLGGGYFLFFIGVYVRPALIYRRNLRYLLNGRKRVTTGIFKEFSEDVTDRDGMEVYAMLLNVGQKNDPEDDRLFYYDAYKPLPTLPIGSRVTVYSNDKLVSSMDPA